MIINSQFSVKYVYSILGKRTSYCSVLFRAMREFLLTTTKFLCIFKIVITWVSRRSNRTWSPNVTSNRPVAAAALPARLQLRHADSVQHARGGQHQPSGDRGHQRGERGAGCIGCAMEWTRGGCEVNPYFLTETKNLCFSHRPKEPIALMKRQNSTVCSPNSNYKYLPISLSSVYLYFCELVFECTIKHVHAYRQVCTEKN